MADPTATAPSATLRPTTPSDTAEIVALAEATGVFKPLEIVALGEVLYDYHAEAFARGHESVTAEIVGRVVGFAYFAPAAMTDRTWYLYWIAVDKSLQGLGLGRSLLIHAEERIGAQKGRLLLIETSSLPHYEPTRRFYLKQGYAQAAVLEDFYAEGDHMVVFRKPIA